MLARFARLRAALSGTAAAAETVLTGVVTAGLGELVMVETAAGTVRAMLVGETGAPITADEGDAMDAVGKSVQLSVRADAVTLQEPSSISPTSKTSARNRVRGTVAELSPGQEVVTVAVDIGLPDPLLALVTRESVDKLGLEPGSAVVATFKATATRGTTLD
jgi:molybdate transport system regulatory protein